MKLPHSHAVRRVSAPALTLTLAAVVIFAQQPLTNAPATQSQPASQSKTPTPQTNASSNANASNVESVSLDDLFGADAYAIYGEMRGVGQYVSSDDFKQMLEPLRLPGQMPAEMSDLLDFFATHAESLASARVAFGAMPVAEGLPNFVAAVELPSAEDAQRLEPQIRKFVAGYYAAHLQATTDESGAPAGNARGRGAVRTATLGTGPDARASEDSSGRANAGASARETNVRGARAQAAQTQAQAQRQQGAQVTRANDRVSTEAAVPYVIRRAGAVVALADKQFTFRRLRGSSASPALANEPGFAAARSRLSTDTLFLYFNTTRMGRYTKRQVEESERRYKEMEAEAAKERGANANSNVAVLASPHAMTMNGNVSVATIKPDDDPSDEEMTPEERAEEIKMRAQFEEERRKAEEEERQRKLQPGYEQEQRQREFENQLGRVVFGGGVFGSGMEQGGGGWPESIGVGVSLAGDEIVARSLFYSDSDAAPARPIPFVPILLSGPPVASEAASVAPKDSDIYISASLDLPQMYDYVSSVFKLFDAAAGASGSNDKLGLFDSQINAFEQQSKFRIKDDLLNSLGNEIAVVLPGEYLGVRRARRAAKPKPPGSTADAQAQGTPTETSAPIVIISLKDKKNVEALIPRALDAAGLKGVSESQLFVKRGDADVLAFGGGSIAFLGNFLIVSFDAQAMDWIIDAYNRGETLANSDEFRRASAWQERQLLGQVFVSNGLLKETFGNVHDNADDIEDASLRAYLTSLDPNPGAITYSLTKDGASLFHELHVPKNLLALISADSIVAQQTATLRRNESMAWASMSGLAGAESSYREKNGRYATLDELQAGTKKGQPVSGRMGFMLFSTEGYEIKLNVSGDKFDATATPTGYPKQGRRSFYIDQTGVVRGGDTGGKPANADSDPISN
jgi:hypothetical protein